MDIRLAQEKDLDQIMEIVKDTVKEMHENNNFQWDSNYPSREVFIDDIENKVLYLAVEDDTVAGFVVFNFDYPDSYSELVWKSNDGDYIIHRLAVSIKQRKNGVAKLLIEFGEKLALEKKMDYIRADTSSKNIKAQKFFENLGFKYVGKVKFPDLVDYFFCYEKELKL